MPEDAPDTTTPEHPPTQPRTRRGLRLSRTSLVLLCLLALSGIASGIVIGGGEPEPIADGTTRFILWALFAFAAGGLTYWLTRRSSRAFNTSSVSSSFSASS